MQRVKGVSGSCKPNLTEPRPSLTCYGEHEDLDIQSTSSIPKYKLGEACSAVLFTIGHYSRKFKVPNELQFRLAGHGIFRPPTPFFKLFPYLNRYVPSPNGRRYPGCGMIECYSIQYVGLFVSFTTNSIAVLTCLIKLKKHAIEDFQLGKSTRSAKDCQSLRSIISQNVDNIHESWDTAYCDFRVCSCFQISTLILWPGLWLRLHGAKRKTKVQNENIPRKFLHHLNS